MIDYLIGSRQEGRIGVSDIGRETHCRIAVNFNPNSRGSDPTAPMTISFNAYSRYHGASAQRVLYDARDRVHQLLAGYMDLINDWGGKGRLIYDVASSFPGKHRPEESTSRAIYAKNPFSGWWNFISLVELPFKISGDGCKSYHAAFLLRSTVLAKCKQHNCYVNVCMNGFKIPVKSCAPYLLVVGNSWQMVDIVVDIINETNQEHVDSCSCDFLECGEIAS